MQTTAPGFERRDLELLDELDDGFATVRHRAGANLACAEGCSDCCIGPFPVTRLDVQRLRRAMLDADETVAQLTRSDARRALDTMREGFPGDIDSGRLNDDKAALDAFFEKHADLVCPVLDTKTGSCRLYAARPISCRTYGPPIAFERQPAPHCTLCFREASSAEIETCRWSPDPADREQALLRELGVPAGEDWAMLIAHAVTTEDDA